MHELHFTYTFHDQNLYIFVFKMLLTRLSDMSKFAVKTWREHWSKKSGKLSPFLSVVCTQHPSLAVCILRVDPETRSFESMNMFRNTKISFFDVK